MAFFIISPEIYSWVILPLLIFFARICDVSLETIRVVYISKGIKYLAPIIAFFEIVIWLLAMEVVLTDLGNILNFLAYAFGFAMGTYVGLVLEERLSIGMVIIRIITPEESSEEIALYLQQENIGVTEIDGLGSRGTVRILLSLVNRTDLPRILDHLRNAHPHAFFSIEDIRYANEGVFRPKHNTAMSGLLDSLTGSRKKA